MARMAWIDIQMECPFYRKLIRSSKLYGVECDPIDCNLGFDVTHVVRLESQEELKDYLGIFCCDRWKSCPYAQVRLKEWR